MNVLATLASIASLRQPFIVHASDPAVSLLPCIGDQRMMSARRLVWLCQVAPMACVLLCYGIEIVSGPVRTVVWEDGRGDLPSYPMRCA
jgi:hypothetical protein